MDGLKLNKIISNGIEYEVQDSTLYNSLLGLEEEGILKSPKGGLFELAKPGKDYDFPVITGQGAPASLIKAEGIGQRYIDLTATAANGKTPEYVWIEISGDEYGWVPTGITASQIPSVQGYVVSATPPESQYVLWIDTSDDGVLKYYNETTGSWEGINTVWG